MTPIVLLARHIAVVSAVVASLALFAAPIERALADKPATPVTVTNPEIPVTVDNPATNPVPVTVVNPAASPALTSDINTRGRVPYQSSNDKTGNCSGTFCSFTFTAPTSHRIVVKNVSGAASVGSGTLVS